MIDFAGKLFQKGFAYEKLRSLYFDVSKFKDYGKLSGVDLNKIRIGATVDLDKYEKNNPRDFTLLKRCSLSELRKGYYVKTQWGNVRPGWHLESAAISTKYLGKNFDFHISSRELIFPHCENLIAMCGALSENAPAKYWLHCEHVVANSKIVDEKGDNRIILKDLLDKGYTGREIRYWLLSRHYKKPAEFSSLNLENAKKALKRIDNCVELLSNVRSGEAQPEFDQILYDIKQGFKKNLDDDLKISGAMSEIFKGIKLINQLVIDNKVSPKCAGKALKTFHQFNTVLNIFVFPEQNNSEIQKLKQDRQDARNKGNWELADKLRNELIKKGVSVRDMSVEKNSQE